MLPLREVLQLFCTLLLMFMTFSVAQSQQPCLIITVQGIPYFDNAIYFSPSKPPTSGQRTLFQTNDSSLYLSWQNPRWFISNKVFLGLTIAEISSSAMQPTLVCGEWKVLNKDKTTYSQLEVNITCQGQPLNRSHCPIITTMKTTTQGMTNPIPTHTQALTTIGETTIKLTTSSITTAVTQALLTTKAKPTTASITTPSTPSPKTSATKLITALVTMTKLETTQQSRTGKPSKPLGGTTHLTGIVVTSSISTRAQTPTNATDTVTLTVATSTSNITAVPKARASLALPLGVGVGGSMLALGVVAALLVGLYKKRAHVSPEPVVSAAENDTDPTSPAFEVNAPPPTLEIHEAKAVAHTSLEMAAFDA